jgi:hypothetical protein
MVYNMHDEVFKEAIFYEANVDNDAILIILQVGRIIIIEVAKNVCPLSSPIEGAHHLHLVQTAINVRA